MAAPGQEQREFTEPVPFLLGEQGEEKYVSWTGKELSQGTPDRNRAAMGLL